MQYPNKFPAEAVLPKFRKSVENGFSILENVAAQLLEALELAYHVPSGTFLSRVTHEKCASEFRINHYPEIRLNRLQDGTVSRIWPHFDLGVISLLFQDNVGGLEFENRKKKGSFYRVDCESSSHLIVNVSETLQRWTNGLLPAGLHRVSPPWNLEANKEDITVPERYSIVYFCKADRDASVGPLKPFVPEDTEPVYENMSALAYQQKRLQSAY